MKITGDVLAVVLPLLVALVVPRVDGHGALVVPPNRGSVWRFGYDVAPNFDDTENYCGGYAIQWLQNNGKCGICGDAYNGKRHHEAGGIFFSGIITNVYRQGQEIDILINITANHKGYFEFRVCPTPGDNKTEVTQECLDEHLLEMADGSGTKYEIPDNTKDKQHFLMKVKLPPNLSCKHCVLQWHWRTANSWGMCINGSGALGCGPQETYRNCADIAVKGRYYDDLGEDKKNEAMLRFALHPMFDVIQDQLKERHQRQRYRNRPTGKFFLPDSLFRTSYKLGP